MTTDLAHQILVGRIPGEWEFSTIENCNMNSDSLERGIYRGLKLTDLILKIVEKIIEKLIRQQLGNEEMEFSFMTRCGPTNTIFILRQLLEKYLTKKNSYFPFAHLEKTFNRVTRDVV